jgi:hypothetical protein
MTDQPTADRVTALYDAIDAFQRQHRTTGGLQHAQIRALLAEHLDAALPAAPAVAPTAPPAADLRNRIAEALMSWAERNNAPQYATMRRPDTVVQNAYSRADAVLAVLPAPTDQAAPAEPADRRARYAAAIRDTDGWVLDGGQHMVDAVMAVADAEQTALRAEVERLRADRATDGIDWKAKCEAEHARHVAVVETLLADRGAVLRERADFLDGCLRNAADPSSDPRYWAAIRDVAMGLRRLADEAQQPETEADVTVHACPGPYDNGMTPCCHRPPFEVPGERITRDPASVTCTGAAPTEEPTR